MKNFIKKTKGITLIALIITVIVLLILAGVAIGSINGGLIDKVKQATAEYNNSVNTEGDTINNTTGWFDNVNGGSNEGEGSQSNLGSTDGSWDNVAKVNTPKLAAGMTPVAWDGAGNEITPNTQSEWYDYANQQWANAKTADGSYWVWIPRYEYQIDYTGVKQGVDADVSKAGKIDIIFIPTSTKSGSDGYTTATSKRQVVNGVTVDTGITVSSDGYIIHPAFTNGTNDGYANGEWDSELAGFWVAKYETSMENSAGESVKTTVSYAVSNVALSDSARAVSKPGVIPWQNINIANCYENALNYGTKLEHNEYNSHLAKNSEWGATAYLTQSKFGRNGKNVTWNNSKDGNLVYTGGGAGEAYKTNVNQSTTGNVSGVYDLNGGSYEYVAAFNNAYVDGGTGYFLGTDYISASKNNFASTGGSSTRYATAYSNSTGTSYATNLSDFTNIGGVDVDVSHIGDGIQEAWIKGQYGWFQSWIGFTYSSFPFLCRGGLGFRYW
ncbi:MAG: hypothetical protein FWF46_05550 [Oscillospiraceae bacterium]|nr:hypothetical protein [Oscillospiraceae bacterium]